MIARRPYALPAAILATLALVAGSTTAAAAPSAAPDVIGASAPGAEPSGLGAAVSTAARGDTTRPAEARRVDRVKTPKPDWFDCSAAFGDRTECASVKLPLDYDRPKGAQTEVAMLRVKATNPKRKIGTLFLNPGGPGGSGVQMAATAPFFLTPSVLARFDVVGMDPRGVNYSDNVRCWKNLGEQAAALSGMDTPFPYTAKETRGYIASSKKFGRACSTTGRPLSAHMATGNVARDMDVLRRMLGDKKLTYLGFSYGSYLGNVYANLFPDRVRAVTIDGVVDPIAWSGTLGNTNVPQTARIKSGQGAAKALDEILRRCKKTGPDYCALAANGDPRRTYAKIIAALKKQPLPITDPDTGEVFFELTYAMLINFLLSDLYSPDGYAFVDADLTFVWDLLQQRASGSAKPDKAGKAAASRASRALIAKFEAKRAAEKAEQKQAAKRQVAVRGFAFPYNNAPEAFQSVLCTDSRNPANAGRWPTYAARANSTAPGFGPLWTWASAPCASNTWTVQDRDAYAGRFTHRTSAPVLVVGNYWDPATNYQGAVTAASLLPRSRLLSSNSWGHTAYGTSACVTGAVDRYLLTGAVPKKGARCTGDIQPFTEPLGQLGEPQRRKAAPPARPLPPVVPPLPGALPRS